MPVSASRRSLFKLTMLGAAGLALPRLATGSAAAQTAGPDKVPPAFYRFTIGGFEITTLSDGTRPSDGPHPIFGQDQPAEKVAALLKENFLPADRFVNGFTPTLVNTGAELVLFDTGLGEGAREAGMGQMRERLADCGYAPEDVDIVVLTHFHGDHIGGMTEGGEPAFPNARIVIGRTEYDYWTAPERSAGPTEANAGLVEAKVKPFADKATFIGDGDTVVDGITGMAAPGHTPGHMVFRIESEGKALMLTADTANHYVASLQRPDWQVQYDTDKEMAAATRRDVFDRIAAERIPFTGYHMPFPAVGFAEKIAEGYRFTPATYQFQI